VLQCVTWKDIKKIKKSIKAEDIIRNNFMPFKSKKQRQWMYANNPKMAEEWESETPKGEKLREKAKKKGKK